MNKMKKIVLFFLLVFLPILTGCSESGEEEGTTSKEATQTEAVASEERTTQESDETAETSTTADETAESSTNMEDGTTEDAIAVTTPDGEVDTVTLDGMTRDILKNMTLEEKVGQMFVFGLDTLRTDGKTGKTKKVTKSIENMMEVYRPGGIILYSKNMKNQKQTKQLISDLQANTRVPLFIGTEESGGENGRIASVSGMKVEEYSDLSTLGENGNENATYDTAAGIASYMKELGFNVNFAPSADLAEEESDTSIKENSFGTDENTVSKLVSAFVKGTQDTGISSVLSTFPGLGAATGDTRKGAVDITKTISQLRKTEFVPFTAGIKAGVDFIMVGHSSYSSITENQTPASLSKLMVTEVLRKELQYDSIIITESMNERAITDVYSVTNSVVKAVKAGADMLLYPGESGKKAYQAVLSAVKSGKITESRIEESVTRILKVKIKRGLISLDTGLIEK